MDKAQTLIMLFESCFIATMMFSNLVVDKSKYPRLKTILDLGALVAAIAVVVTALISGDIPFAVFALLLVAMAIVFLLIDAGVIKPPKTAGGTEPDKPG